MVPVGFRAVQRWTGLGELQGGPGTQLSALRRGSFPLLPLGEAELEDLGDASGAEPPLPGAETCLGWAPSLGAGWECPGATIPVSDVPVLGQHASPVPTGFWGCALGSGGSLSLLPASWVPGWPRFICKWWAILPMAVRLEAEMLPSGPRHTWGQLQPLPS